MKPSIVMSTTQVSNKDFIVRKVEMTSTSPTYWASGFRLDKPFIFPGAENLPKADSLVNFNFGSDIKEITQEDVKGASVDDVEVVSLDVGQEVDQVDQEVNLYNQASLVNLGDQAPGVDLDNQVCKPLDEPTKINKQNKKPYPKHQESLAGVRRSQRATKPVNRFGYIP